MKSRWTLLSALIFIVFQVHAQMSIYGETVDTSYGLSHKCFQDLCRGRSSPNKAAFFTTTRLALNTNEHLFSKHSKYYSSYLDHYFKALEIHLKKLRELGAVKDRKLKIRSLTLAMSDYSLNIQSFIEKYATLERVKNKSSNSIDIRLKVLNPEDTKKHLPHIWRVIPRLKSFLENDPYMALELHTKSIRGVRSLFLKRIALLLSMNHKNELEKQLLVLKNQVLALNLSNTEDSFKLEELISQSYDTYLGLRTPLCQSNELWCSKALREIVLDRPSWPDELFVMDIEATKKKCLSLIRSIFYYNHNDERSQKVIENLKNRSLFHLENGFLRRFDPATRMQILGFLRSIPIIFEPPQLHAQELAAMFLRAIENGPPLSVAPPLITPNRADFSAYHIVSTLNSKMKDSWPWASPTIDVKVCPIRVPHPEKPNLYMSNLGVYRSPRSHKHTGLIRLTAAGISTPSSALSLLLHEYGHAIDYWITNFAQGQASSQSRFKNHFLRRCLNDRYTKLRGRSLEVFGKKKLYKESLLTEDFADFVTNSSARVDDPWYCILTRHYVSDISVKSQLPRIGQLHRHSHFLLRMIFQYLDQGRQIPKSCDGLISSLGNDVSKLKCGAISSYVSPKIGASKDSTLKAVPSVGKL